MVGGTLGIGEVLQYAKRSCLRCSFTLLGISSKYLHRVNRVTSTVCTNSTRQTIGLILSIESVLGHIVHALCQHDIAELCPCSTLAISTIAKVELQFL